MPYYNGAAHRIGKQSLAVFRSTHISDTTVGHARRAIREKIAKSITGYYYHPHVDASLAERSVQMDHIHNQQIASRRNLHFNTDANTRAIDDLALDPVHVAGNLLGPTAEVVELFIDEFPNSSSPVRILLLFNQEAKPG